MRGSPGRRAWASAWIPFGLWIAIIFGLSSLADLGPPQVGLPFADKFCHAGEYGILGALWTRARGGGRAAMITTAALLGGATGIVDEAYQSTVPGREVDAFDVVADTVGAAAGAWVWTRVQRRRSRSQR